MSLPSFDELGAKLYPVLDWFIPPATKAEMEALRRARMFLISHLFGPFLGHTISLYILFIDPHPDWAWYTFFGLITLFWAFPLALKVTGWYVPLALISVQNLIFTVLWGCYHYGGTSSPLIPWVITVPLLAFFYLGSGTVIRAYVMSIIVVNLAAFYAIYSYGDGFPQHVPPEQLSGLGLVSMFCAAGYVSMMALYYANIVNSQSELEQEVKRRMETAQQLRGATDEAHRANQAKSEFLAKMSHELRTPLNAVIGYSAVLLDELTADQDDSRKDLKKIHNAGKRLLKLITDLLDFSKLEAGKMELFLEPTEPAAMIETILDEFREQIAESGNEIVVECDPALVVQADQIKLHRTIADLVGNAIKATSDGKVAIRVTSDDEWLRVTVDDNGIGIDADVLPLLFEAFKESEEETSSKYAEVGLGLPVSQRLCQLMGGQITAISTPGRGSSFTVSLPTTKSEPPASSRAPLAPVPNGLVSGGVPTVLIIDDDIVSLELAAQMVEAEGFSALTASSVEEGVAILQTHRPNLILLDGIMPGMDGWQMLDMLKVGPSYSDCPVVMLTGDDDRERSMALGADAHIVKPLTRPVLREALRVANMFASGDAKAVSPREAA
jgi:signal transduction histidine kinase/ActR/RegA family two-component response regulator